MERRAFWIGYRSAFDITGRATKRDWDQYQRDARRIAFEETS